MLTNYENLKRRIIFGRFVNIIIIIYIRILISGIFFCHFFVNIYV